MTATDQQNETLKPLPAKTPLGASLAADYEALQNDLEQAKELAADFQRQLAGKSNEVAHFKGVVQKTHEDFMRLEGHIRELRQERHRLANEAMRVAALDLQIVKLKQENENLRGQLETLNKASSQRVEELLVVTEESQKEVQRLRGIVEVLRRREGIPPILMTSETSAMQQQIAELTATVKRLQSQVGLPSYAASRATMPETEESESDVINISFER